MEDACDEKTGEVMDMLRLPGPQFLENSTDRRQLAEIRRSWRDAFREVMQSNDSHKIELLEIIGDAESFDPTSESSEMSFDELLDQLKSTLPAAEHDRLRECVDAVCAVEYP